MAAADVDVGGGVTAAAVDAVIDAVVDAVAAGALVILSGAVGVGFDALKGSTR